MIVHSIFSTIRFDESTKLWNSLSTRYDFIFKEVNISFKLCLQYLKNLKSNVFVIKVYPTLALFFLLSWQNTFSTQRLKIPSFSYLTNSNIRIQTFYSSINIITHSSVHISFKDGLPRQNFLRNYNWQQVWKCKTLRKHF